MKDKIPDGENSKDWIEYKKRFVKVPSGMDPSSYKVQLDGYVNSDRPLAPIKILKVRVLKKTDIEDE